ncbi:ribonuclease H-like protein, partial [Trametes versicolor FP-101664 SS1]|uniref:ribonuclease H-like protein n=1 Tax=Trametes versicolor (strain FP-101664) TaxID=717944 RepID=UPI0004623384
QERLADLYGPVWAASDRVDVWTDGSARSVNDTMCAGAGVCWGLNATANVALRVPGESQTNNRAELFAVLHALRHANPVRSLALHTDSTYVIHSICHWAPRNAELGWIAAHSDLLQSILQVLRARGAPVRFCWVKVHAGNALNDLADRLAKLG